MCSSDLLPLVERIAAGQVVTASERQRAIELATTLRRQVLHDNVPRSTSRMIEKAFTDAALLGVQLFWSELIEGDPPPGILAVFSDALSSLIVNLKHAGVTSARLAVDASEESISLTLVDDGKGRPPEAAWGPSVEGRVKDALKVIEGSARVLTEPGGGVTCRLEWARDLVRA